MKILYTLCAFVLLASCNTDEKTIEVVLYDVERGAFLRTIEIENAEFDINNTESPFTLTIQEQDLEEGELMQEVFVYAQFIDNTTGSENLTTGRIQIETLVPDDFSPGSFDLPVTTVSYTYAELLDFTNISMASVSCKDQFIVSFDLVLTNGFIFNEDNAAACILAFNTDFSSPFSYTINVVEPITSSLFTGSYFYSSIVDGPFGPTFGEPFLVDVELGHSNNVRSVKFDNFPARPPRSYLFSIVCDEIVFGKNQVRYNTLNSSCGEDGQPILLGPDTVNPMIDPADDTVFELWFVEGYKGFDGGLGFGTLPSRLRLVKQ